MKTWREDREWKGPAIVQPKLDGVAVEVTGKGLVSKSGTPITTQPHINRRLRGYFRRNRGALLRGELYKHGKPFEDIQAAVQEGGRRSKLQLHVFPEGQRRLPLPIFGIRRVRSKLVATQEQADREYARALRKGYEGQVIKTASGTFKRKPYQDAEFRLMAIRRGKPGKVGAAMLQGPRGPFKAVLGNAALSRDDLGKPVTVKYQRLTRRGVPRGAVVKARREEGLADLRRPIEFGYRRASPDVQGAVAETLNRLNRTASLYRPWWVAHARDAGGVPHGMNAQRARVVVDDAGKNYVVTYRGVNSGGRNALIGKNYTKPTWRDTPPNTAPPMTTDYRIARGFAGMPRGKRYIHGMPGAASRGRNVWKRARPNVGTFLLPIEDLPKSNLVRGIAALGAESEVRNAAARLVRIRKFTRRGRLIEFGSMGMRRIGRVGYALLGKRRWKTNANRIVGGQKPFAGVMPKDVERIGRIQDKWLRKRWEAVGRAETLTPGMGSKVGEQYETIQQKIWGNVAPSRFKNRHKLSRSGRVIEFANYLGVPGKLKIIRGKKANKLTGAIYAAAQRSIASGGYYTKTHVKEQAKQLFEPARYGHVGFIPAERRGRPRLVSINGKPHVITYRGVSDGGLESLVWTGPGDNSYMPGVHRAAVNTTMRPEIAKRATYHHKGKPAVPREGSARQMPEHREIGSKEWMKMHPKAERPLIGTYVVPVKEVTKSLTGGVPKVIVAPESGFIQEAEVRGVLGTHLRKVEALPTPAGHREYHNEPAPRFKHKKHILTTSERKLIRGWVVSADRKYLHPKIGYGSTYDSGPLTQKITFSPMQDRKLGMMEERLRREKEKQRRLNTPLGLLSRRLGKVTEFGWINPTKRLIKGLKRRGVGLDRWGRESGYNSAFRHIQIPAAKNRGGGTHGGSPVLDLWHEAGHDLTRWKKDPTKHPLLYKANPVLAADLERAANRAASKAIAKLGGDLKLQLDYRGYAQRHYRGYVDPRLSSRAVMRKIPKNAFALEQLGPAIEFGPTEGQRLAGNYAKKHLWFQGLNISIETRKGAWRTGTSKDGTPWRIKMPCDYGYIRGTNDADGEHVDVFLGPDRESPFAAVVNRRRRDGTFDEHKILLGFRSMGEARIAYFGSYQPGHATGYMLPTTVAALKAWLGDGKVTAPFDTSDAVMGQHEFSANQAGAGSEQPPPVPRTRRQRELRRIRNMLLGGAFGGGLGSMIFKKSYVGGRIGVGVGSVIGAVIPPKKLAEFQARVPATEFSALGRWWSSVGTNPIGRQRLKSMTRLYKLAHPKMNPQQRAYAQREIREVGDALAQTEKSTRNLVVGAGVIPPVLSTAVGIAATRPRKPKFDEPREFSRVTEFRERIPTEADLRRKYEPILKQLKRDAVLANSVNTGKVPVVSTYREVTAAGKDQGYGLIRRHATAVATRPSVWGGANAFFVPRGKTGIIIAPKKINPNVIKHEAGHAADYKALGGEKGWKATRERGSWRAAFSRKRYIRHVMLPEEIAWARSGVKKDNPLRGASLATYAEQMPNFFARRERPVEFAMKPLLVSGIALGSLAGVAGVDSYLRRKRRERMKPLADAVAQQMMRRQLVENLRKHGVSAELRRRPTEFAFGGRFNKLLPRALNVGQLTARERRAFGIRANPPSNRAKIRDAVAKWKSRQGGQSCEFAEKLTDRQKRIRYWLRRIALPWRKVEPYPIGPSTMSLTRRGKVIEFVSGEPAKRKIVKAGASGQSYSVSYGDFLDRSARYRAAYADAVAYGQRFKKNPVPEVEKWVAEEWGKGKSLARRKLVVRHGYMGAAMVGIQGVPAKAIIRKAITRKFQRNGRVIEFEKPFVGIDPETNKWRDDRSHLRKNWLRYVGGVAAGAGLLAYASKFGRAAVAPSADTEWTAGWWESAAKRDLRVWRAGMRKEYKRAIKKGTAWPFPRDESWTPPTPKKGGRPPRIPVEGFSGDALPTPPPAATPAPKSPPPPPNPNVSTEFVPGHGYVKVDNAAINRAAIERRKQGSHMTQAAPANVKGAQVIKNRTTEAAKAGKRGEQPVYRGYIENPNDPRVKRNQAANRKVNRRNAKPKVKMPTVTKPAAKKPGKQAPTKPTGKKRRLEAILRPTFFDHNVTNDEGKFVPGLGPRSAYRKARRLVPVIRRTGEVTQDLGDMISRTPREPGKKRFYEKSWFKSALMAAPLASTIFISRQRQLYYRKTGKDLLDKFLPEKWRGKIPMPGTSLSDGRKRIEFAGTSAGAEAGWETKRRLWEEAMVAGRNDWQIRDARGRSARVYAPGSRPRQRREKKWYERTAALKTIAALGLGVGLAGLSVSGTAMTREMLRRRRLKGVSTHNPTESSRTYVNNGTYAPANARRSRG